jgi:hypothetical protein
MMAKIQLKKLLDESQGAWRQKDLIRGKPSVVK